MSATTQIVTVTGFLGAGKSSLVRHLRETTDWALFEGDPRKTPIADQPGEAHRTVAVVDAVNLAATLDDPVCGALIQAQIRSAGTVVLTRSDVVEPGAALALLARITDVPTLVAPFGRVEPKEIADTVTSWDAPLDLTSAYTEWTYEGPATLSAAGAELLLENRPGGIYRMTGEIVTHEGGLAVEITGRARQTQAIGRPAQTWLRAMGPKTRFTRRDMDLAFSDAAAASAHARGIFGYR